MKYKIWDKVRYLKNTAESDAIVWEEYYIITIDGSSMPYSLWKEKWKHVAWMWVNEKDIELVKEKEEYIEWEEVEVSDNNINWYKRIFIITVPWNVYAKHITVYEWDTDIYLKWENFDISRRGYIRKAIKEEERKIICSDEKWEEIQKILKLNK